MDLPPIPSAPTGAGVPSAAAGRAAGATAGGIDGYRLIGLFCMFAVAVWLWHSPVLFPVKAFVVLLHEISHGLAAVVTGGTIVSISVTTDLGGLCTYRGGWDLVVLPAGYLGSLALGSLILVVSARSRHDRVLSGLIGGVVLLVTLLYIRNGFGLLFGLGFGAAMLALARFGSELANDLSLQFLGLTSCLYAVIDIKEDLIDRTVPNSDAWQMAQKLWLPPVFWGALWILIAVGVTIWALHLAVQRVPTGKPVDD